jgi:uncharacterized damage-inducible protein DinB
MPRSERDEFITVWDFEAKRTADMLRALPAGQYDFRPDPTGRSLGELAWHLSEVDAYISYGIEKGFEIGMKPPNIERPRTIEALAPGYERIHSEAVARIRKLSEEDLDRKLKFFDGTPMAVRDMLWGAILCHLIHHRGQLSLMTRLAGGVPPGLFGPNREAMAAMQAQRG